VSLATGKTRAPLVGRARELEQLSALLGETEGGLAVVSGEAGIGKTRLLEELTEQAAEAGHLTLAGRAAEYERELPFGLVIDALDPYLEALDSQAYQRLVRDRVGELASVFPSLHGLGEVVKEPATATERFRIHNAVRELLERLAARQPILLVLEDVHWADGASRELITHLIRRPPQAEVTLALSFRSGQADPAILRPMHERAERAVVAIELAPLELTDSARLLGAAREVDVAPLQRECGGNPFYLLQLAQSVDSAGPVSELSTLRLDVPAAVRTAIATELAGLSSEGRAVAEVAAVVGDPFEVGLVQAAAGVSEAEFLAALDELAASQLVRVADTPRRFAFRHPLVRNAIYEAAPPGTAIATHRRVADLLVSRGVAASEVAHHVERSAQHGDSEAIEVLQRAAAENMTRAPTSAAGWLRAALELLPGDAADETRRNLLVALGSAEGAAGELDGARMTLEAALALTPPGDPLRASLVIGTVGIEHLTGRQVQAKVRLEEALANAQDEDPETRVALKIALATNGIYLDERDRMYTWGQAAKEEAENLSSPRTRAAAHAAFALGAAFTGRAQVGLEQADAASELLASIDDQELAKNVDAIATVAAAELYLDRYEACRDHAERGMRVARATAQGDLIAFLNPTLGTSLWVLGELDRSAEMLDAAVQGARLTKNPQAIAWAAFNRAVQALMHGDLETAMRLGEESLVLTRDFTGGLISSHAGVVHAGTLLELGQPERAIQLLTERGGGPELTMIAPGSWRATYLEILALSQLALERVDEAASTAGVIRAQADATSLPIAAAMADRAEASVALARGDARSAVELARAAIGKAESVRARPVATTSRMLAGRAMLEAGDPDMAVEFLDRAASDHEAMGSLRYRDQAESLLRKAGVRRARRTRRGDAAGQGPETLTGRELEVAELIRDRRTNKEIATELFLSLKTVESHIRNIFGKLGVSSRVDVARVLEAQPPGQ
jgi:DNA-binding NarL/FixJ family response regulator